MDVNNGVVMTFAAIADPVLNMIVHGHAVAGLAFADDLDSITAGAIICYLVAINAFFTGSSCQIVVSADVIH